jgi:hypothetical protein
MPFFYTYEEEEAYRNGKQDAYYGRHDYSRDCHFGGDVDKAYCRGQQDYEEEEEREREEERQREEEELEAYYRHQEEERQREEEEMMNYYNEQQMPQQEPNDF